MKIMKIMKIYYGSQFPGKTPLEAAEKFFEALIGLYAESATYTFSLVSSDMESERIFSFGGVRSSDHYHVYYTNTVTPQMKWDEEKKIHTDGEFVYTNREQIYARLLDNGGLRPLTMFEENDLKSRGINFQKLSNIAEIYALQRKQYDQESSEEDSESSSSEAEDSEEEEEHKCERTLSPSNSLCGKTARKCLNFPNFKVMWFCGDKNSGCYEVKINELRHVLLHKKEPSEKEKEPSEKEKEPSEKEKEPSEKEKDPETLESVQWNPSYNIYTDGKFVYSGRKRVFGRLYGDRVKPLDITDILMLKEAKIEMEYNYHSNKIPFHMAESRRYREFEFNSDIEGDRVYPDDDPEC